MWCVDTFTAFILIRQRYFVSFHFDSYCPFNKMNLWFKFFDPSIPYFSNQSVLTENEPQNTCLCSACFNARHSYWHWKIASWETCMHRVCMRRECWMHKLQLNDDDDSILNDKLNRFKASWPFGNDRTFGSVSSMVAGMCNFEPKWVCTFISSKFGVLSHRLKCVHVLSYFYLTFVLFWI